MDGRKNRKLTISKLFEQGTAIDRAVQAAAGHARARYKQSKLGIPEWRDGKVVWVSPWEDGEEHETK